MQRKLNIIIYLSEQLNPDHHQGHLGLWSHDVKTNQPRELIKEVSPIFNRAIIFDTTQDSWHGMSQKLMVPDGIYRKSLAIYYLTEPNNAKLNQRAVYAPREDQKNDKQVIETIKLRSDVNQSSSVYKKK